MNCFLKNIFRIFTCCAFFLSVSASMAVASAGDGRAEDTGIPLEVFGEVYHVQPVEIEGAHMSYEQLRPYIPTILTTLDTQYRDMDQTLSYLPRVRAAYERLYNRSVFLLIRRIKHFVPERDLNDLKIEVGDALRAGQWKMLSQKYKHFSASLPPQILEAQKNHNRYLSVFYLSEMIERSNEVVSYRAERAIESPDFEEEGDENEDFGLSKPEKYEYGFRYLTPDQVASYE